MTSKLTTLPPGALTRGGLAQLPSLITDHGEQAAWRFLEFFTAHIRNPNTRLAYARPVGRFCAWCEQRQPTLAQLHPTLVAAHIEQHPGSPPTVKQHLPAIRRLFDWLVIGQIVPFNPASAIRGPTHVVTRGKTPVLTAGQARALLDSLQTQTLVGLRDKALLGLLCYTFARVSAAASIRVEDYYQSGHRWWVRLHEKGGKRHDVPGILAN